MRDLVELDGSLWIKVPNPVQEANPSVPESKAQEGIFSREGMLKTLKKVLRFVGIVGLLAGAAGWLQWRGGVYQAELNGYPDEAAHLITGLMVRDYLVSGIGQSPVEFAENYYLHYPKVGFGIWPPMYHFVEAAWFLITPPGKISAFVLQALITGTLGACVAWMALPYGSWIAILAGLALIGMPTVQLFTGMVMADNLMCLFAFFAMVAFLHYMETWKRRYLFLFGLLTGLALMTKSNAAGLALLPALALLLMKKPGKILSWPMVGAGALTLAIALPWQMLVMKLWTNATSASRYSMEYVVKMIQVHASMYANMPGIVVFSLAIVGVLIRVVIPFRRGTLEPRWASVTGLVLGMFLFGLAPLPPEPRYHVASLAGLTLFAASALYEIRKRTTQRWGEMAGAAVVVFAVVLYGMTTFSIAKREPVGYGEIARQISGNPAYRDSVILVSSQAMGEGMMISEIAPLELRPSHYILRATKMLARSRWNLDQYELLYPDEAKMQEFLESIPVRVLVFDTAAGPMPMPHHQMLDRVIQKNPSKWRQVGQYPAVGTNSIGGQLKVYELQGIDEKKQQSIKIDMRYTLQRVLN